jgi:hypothetical protein
MAGSAAKRAPVVTPEGIDRIIQHLTNLPDGNAVEGFPPNAAMIERLQAALTESQDLNFYERSAAS